MCQGAPAGPHMDNMPQAVGGSCYMENLESIDNIVNSKDRVMDAMDDVVLI